MMKSLALACMLAAPTSGIRVVKKAEENAETSSRTFSIECEYERIAVMLTEGGEAEVGECVTRDGQVFDIDPNEVNWAEFHDVLSLQLQAKATVSVLGEQEYKVVSASLVRHEEVVAELSTASSGYSVLAISSRWSDGGSATTSQIRPNFDQAKTLIRKSSYGSFNFGATTQYTSATVSSRYSKYNGDGNCNARSIREEIIPRTSGVNNYMYRMFFLPNITGCKWAGLAQVGCGRPGNSPRNGACWSMYKGIPFGHSVLCQAHELGHNFGLLHAAGNRNGNFVEYGDETAIMGNKWSAGMQFSAAHRFQLGWLRKTSGEVVQLSRGARRVSKLEENKGTAGAVALQVPCGRCVPRQPDKRSQVGGELFVSYTLGQVRVHLRRVNSGGLRPGPGVVGIPERRRLLQQSVRALRVRVRHGGCSPGGRRHLGQRRQRTVPLRRPSLDAGPQFSPPAVEEGCWPY